MQQEEIFIELGLWISELVLLPPICLFFSCVDPDPQSFLNTEPIWIRMHNTGFNNDDTYLGKNPAPHHGLWARAVLPGKLEQAGHQAEGGQPHSWHTVQQSSVSDPEPDSEVFWILIRNPDPGA